MAYIDREKALEICENHYKHCLEMHDYCGDTTADNIKEDIEKLPTADVVEVVRCKDCDFYIKSKQFRKDWCNKHAMNVKPTDFCSYGERRTDNETL